LFEAVIRALKNEKLPVAGADRLVLTEHIAVMDLMVLADALLLPEDDLALATALRSPLFGIGDKELFDLAWDREGSLRAALRARRPDLAAELDRLTEAARELTPFAFYAKLLGVGGGRKKILSRLGHEANDALDEFLNLALDYERIETPSLQGLVAWLRSAKAEVKRDMEMARDEVRVMTAHGAKGLEAPIVILADTTTPPQGWHPPRLLPLQLKQGMPAQLVWATSKSEDIGPMAAAREAALEEARHEYRRLLYVAMTRAIEQLIVCGVDGKNKRPEGCWYDLVHDALAPLSIKQEHEDGTIWRFRKGDQDAAVVPAKQSQPPAPPLAPAWLMRDAPREAPKSVVILPSIAYEEEINPARANIAVPSPLVGGREQEGAGRAREFRHALARGRLVHRLMQSLPDIPSARRAEAAQHYLARAGAEFTGEQRDLIAAQVRAVLDDPRFSELFAPGSRAEAPIVGRLFRDGKPPLIVSGQIDRLAVTADAVLIADYKTNRPAPETPPDAYVAQLALYRAVLGRLYPDKTIRAALIWTEVPDIVELSSHALDAALAAIVSR
jgi:ATP-dependent helicase/nuclease subunit A